MPEIIDDKSEHCVPFILDRITKHRESFASKGGEPTPFFVGLNGVQGAGKTTLVREVHSSIFTT
jgi:D-glycerate 3-kinase